MFGPIEKIVAWLRAGYPEGIPARDYVPLVALLRRRMTDDEIEEVGRRLDAAGIRPAEESHVGAQMMAVLDEVPAPDEIHRVAGQLRTLGWPVLDEDASLTVMRPTVHAFYGPASSGKTTVARQLAAAGAIRFSLGAWMTRLFPGMPRGSQGHAEMERVVKDLIKEVAAQVLSAGGDVVLDWSAATRSERALLVEWAARWGGVVVLHDMSADGTVASEDDAVVPEPIGAGEQFRVVQGRSER